MGRCDCPRGLMDFRESSLPYHFDWSETDRRGPLSAAASASEPWRARHHGAPVGTMVGVASFHGHAAFALPDFGQMRVFNAAKGRIPKPKTRCWSGIDWNLRYRLIADSKRLTEPFTKHRAESAAPPTSTPATFTTR